MLECRVDNLGHRSIGMVVTAVSGFVHDVASEVVKADNKVKRLGIVCNRLASLGSSEHVELRFRTFLHSCGVAVGLLWCTGGIHVSLQSVELVV